MWDGTGLFLRKSRNTRHFSRKSGGGSGIRTRYATRRRQNNNVERAHAKGLKQERKEGICRNKPLTFCRNDKSNLAKCLIYWWAHQGSNLGPAD
jgi:hypothetical protein